MPTLDKPNFASRQISPADLRPEDVMVAFFIERFRQLPSESLGDIIDLVKEITSPGTSPDDRIEIYETIREILFPDLVGEIRLGRAGAVEQSPNRVQCRTKHIGSTIKRKREANNLTQVELAKLSGLPQSHICRLEAGVHSPSFKTLEKIARALGVTVGDLDPS
jgi:DNA-binding XRE family transcriptional regulator